MKRVFMLLPLAVFMTSICFAGENETLEAPADIIKENIEYCADMAKEQNIEAVEHTNFMLTCVNEWLIEQGFIPVESIKE